MLNNRMTNRAGRNGYNQWADIFPTETREKSQKKSSEIGIPLKWLPPILGMALFLVLAAVGIPAHMVRSASGLQTVKLEDQAREGQSQKHVQLASTSVENILTGSRKDVLPVQFSQYTVTKEDSLSLLAFRFNLDPMTLLQVNGLHNPTRIKEGTVLTIPSTDGLLHKVGKGESFQDLRDKYQLNDRDYQVLLNSTPVLPGAGEKIFIPGAAVSEDKRKALLSDVFLYPANGPVITEFGTVTDPVSGIESQYNGIDLAVPRGTEIKASRDGVVMFSAVHPSLGTCVILGHNGGYSTLYGQLTSSYVAKGQKVLQGEALGVSGNPVFGKADHLFFSLKKQGKVIDPLTLLY